MPSSVIRDFAYDIARHTLRITFTSGRRYHYHQVPAATYEGMKASSSKGAFFNREIRDHFQFSTEA